MDHTLGDTHNTLRPVQRPEPGTQRGSKRSMKRKLFLATAALALSAGAARADDSPAIQAMLDGCYAGTSTCVIDLQGAKKVLQTTLRVDPELVSIHNAIFDCQMKSGTCLYVSEDGYGHRGSAQIATRLDGLTLLGNKSIDGITMNYSDKIDKNTNAAMTLFNVRIQGFNNGISLGSNVWGADMYNVVIGGGNVGIYTQPNPFNGGERNTFSGGAIYNNAVAGIKEDSSYEFDFQGVSFDFNTQQMLLKGPTDFTGHIENNDNGLPEIDLDALPGVSAGSLYMSAGSTIVVDGWNAKTTKQPCYIVTHLAWNNVKAPAGTYGFGGTQGAVCGPGTVATWDGKPLSQ